MWKKNIRMIPWPDLYMLKKWISAYTLAAKLPLSQRRRCPMSSAAVSGTSVSALLGLT